MLLGKKPTPADLAGIARRRWPVVVVPFVACAFAALIVSASLPNVYQSHMQISVIPQRVPNSIVPSTVTMKVEDRIGALSEEVRSRSALEPMIERLNLYASEREHMPMQDVVEIMQSAIDIQVIQPRGEQPVSTFTLSFRYNDAAMAAQVTKQLGDMIVEKNFSERGKLASNTSRFLDDQLREAKQHLDEQDLKVKSFREQHAGSLPSQQESNAALIQSTRSQLQAAIADLQRERDRKENLQSIYNFALAQPVIVATPPPAPAASPAQGAAVPQGTARQQLQSARAQLDVLSDRYSDDHPDVRRQRRLVADLEKRVAAEPPPVVASADAPAPQTAVVANVEERARIERLQQMRADIASAERQITFRESEEQRLRKLLSDYELRLEATPALESEWLKLTRDNDILRLQYNDLLSKSQQARVSLELELQQIGEQFRVLDPARVPVRPIAPVRLQINGIGAVLGLVIGLGIVALLELRDSTFRTENDVVEVLALPVLALVPLVRDETDIRRGKRRLALAVATTIVGVTGAGYVFWTMQLWKHIV